MARHRREIVVFSLSFMDCICCGFGAMILMFVLTARAKVDQDDAAIVEVQVDIDALNRSIAAANKDLAAKDQSLQALVLTRDRRRLSEEDLGRQVDGLRKELAALEARTGNLSQAEKDLLGKLAALPTTDQAVPLPDPGAERRQYLTDFKTSGERVLILVECSGSMLSTTIADATARVSGTEAQRLEAPKWVRVRKATEWIVGCLRAPSKFQVAAFNADTVSLMPHRSKEWLSLGDAAGIATMLGSLRELAPSGPANHERAMAYASSLQPPPDNIILITDGLPTASDSILTRGGTSEDERVRMLNAAWGRRPLTTPLNVMLFPMEGDATAAANFWLWGAESSGSFLCPAPNWPDK